MRRRLCEARDGESPSLDEAEPPRLRRCCAGCRRARLPRRLRGFWRDLALRGGLSSRRLSRDAPSSLGALDLLRRRRRPPGESGSVSSSRASLEPRRSLEGPDALLPRRLAARALMFLVPRRASAASALAPEMGGSEHTRDSAAVPGADDDAELRARPGRRQKQAPREDVQAQQEQQQVFRVQQGSGGIRGVCTWV